MQAEARAREHYRARHRLEDALARLARQLWGKVDPANLDGSWARIAPQLLVGVAGSQLAAARMADTYTDDVLGDDAPAVADVVPDAFAGVASDGRPLDSLLRNPLTVVKAAIGQGAVLDRAMAGGYANLDMIVRTQLADAGRGADQAAIVARPDVAGYTRILSPPSCSRCVILAGRFYRWNAGFQRHPRCDCLHVPAVSAGDGVRTDPRGYFDSLSRAEQDKAFTRAGAEAIRDGADMARVVNARRGMYEAGGKLFTTEAATRAGVNRRIRLMPEQIYREAGDDRDEAIRLLRAHGYLRGTPTRAVPRTVPAQQPIPAPRAPSMSPEAARYQLNLKGIEDLAERVETQLSQARRSGIHEGIQGDKKKLRWPDGVALFSKSYADDVWKLGATKARYTVDAEQLAGVLGQALGVNVPRVFRRDEYGIFTDWSTDAPQFRVEKRKDGFDVIERAMRSDDGIRIGLLDMLTGNIDRHSGNILIGAGGKVTGIDQGLAWSGALDRLATVGSTEFAESASVFMLGPAKVHFVDGSRISGFGDNPLTRADIAWIRRRMNSLRPLFEHLGRGRFLDYSNAVLDLLERHAKGSRRIFGA